jgi:uncharacterized membrane protein
MPLLVAFSACSADSDEPPDAAGLTDGGANDANICATSLLTYANFGQPFMSDYCLECHSITSADRRGAPLGVNFDEFSEIVAQKDRIRARAGVGTSMPRGTGVPKPTVMERDDLVEWIDCGPTN